MSFTKASVNGKVGANPLAATDIVEMESIMSLDQPLDSKVVPRWERKRLQRMASGGDGDKVRW